MSGCMIWNQYIGVYIASGTFYRLKIGIFMQCYTHPKCEISA
jgi:hypothetical protein